METIGIITTVLVLMFIILVPLLAWYYQYTIDRTGRFPKGYFRKRLGKCFGWEVTLYGMQEGRWELGITYDINGSPLISVSLLLLDLEFEKL